LTFANPQKKKSEPEKVAEQARRTKVERVGDERDEVEEEEEEETLVPHEKDVSMRSISMSSEMEHLEPTGQRADVGNFMFLTKGLGKNCISVFQIFL
jgi:hypothetical protein